MEPELEGLHGHSEKLRLVAQTVAGLGEVKSLWQLSYQTKEASLELIWSLNIWE